MMDILWFGLFDSCGIFLRARFGVVNEYGEGAGSVCVCSVGSIHFDVYFLNIASSGYWRIESESQAAIAGVWQRWRWEKTRPVTRPRRHWLSLGHGPSLGPTPLWLGRRRTATAACLCGGFPLGGKRGRLHDNLATSPTTARRPPEFSRLLSRLSPPTSSRPPPPHSTMVTVRNPTPKLSDELYKAMQAILDSLFNQKDSEFRPPPPPPLSCEHWLIIRETSTETATFPRRSTTSCQSGSSRTTTSSSSTHKR